MAQERLQLLNRLIHPLRTHAGLLQQDVKVNAVAVSGRFVIKIRPESAFQILYELQRPLRRPEALGLQHVDVAHDERVLGLDPGRAEEVERVVALPVPLEVLVVEVVEPADVVALHKLPGAHVRADADGSLFAVDVRERGRAKDAG